MLLVNYYGYHNSDYADYQALLSNTLTHFVCFNQDDTISSLNGKPLKLLNQSIQLGSNISSAESDVDLCVGKTWIAIDRLSAISKFDIDSKIKREFFQTVSVSVLLYSCTKYTRMPRGVLNKSWKQHPTKQQSLSCYHAKPPNKTKYISWPLLVKDELIRNVLPWTPTRGHTIVGFTSKTLHSSDLCGHSVPSRWLTMMKKGAHDVTVAVVGNRQNGAEFISSNYPPIFVIGVRHAKGERERLSEEYSLIPSPVYV